MESNKEDLPTGTSYTLVGAVPFQQVHAEMLERCAWALSCMPVVWDRFITLLEAKTFTLDEITREHKRLKNLYGSVDEHRKAFLEAAASLFDAQFPDSMKGEKA